MRRLFSLMLVVLFASAASAAALTEPQKIDALLDAFVKDDVTFIRNGISHDGAWAKEHLQDKLKDMKDVTTASDFIAKVATSSSHSGKPYMVKLKDGTKMESGQWLKAKLDDLEKQDKPAEGK